MLTLNMEQQTVVAVQSFLSPGDKCITCIEAGLVRDWVKTSRILVLVEHAGDYGFFILISAKPNVSSSTDLSVEKAFPVNDDFKCEIDASGIDLLAGADVYVKVTYQKQKFLFELPFSPKSNAFVSQVSKASESHSLRMGPPPDIRWLQRYITTNNHGANFFSFLENSDIHDNFDTQSVKSAVSFQENFASLKVSNDSRPSLSGAHSDSDLSRTNNLHSPDFGNLPRQSIAMGATPLAARESVIRLQMVMREDDYTDLHNYRIFVGTWNVNGQSPTVSVAGWLASDPEPPDIYAIGFQELDLSKEVFLFSDSPKEEEWLCAVINGLHPAASYRKVKLVRLIGMMLIVFVQEKHADHIDNVSAETVGTGIMGKLGNKGGVAVRFDFHNTSVCFVNCHFAAHVEEFERRNQDYNDICTRMVFNSFKSPKCIKDHDQIYWLGDMNYRINELDIEQVKSLIEKQCYSVLLEHDQLHIQCNSKRVFVGYTEGSVNFMPTYKYDPGTNKWDSSEKSRPPAWCDRILWKGHHISQLCYRSHPQLMISDHKPVSSLFDSGIKVVDVIRYRRIYEEVMKKLDKLENEFLPQVTVDKMEVQFGTVTFIESKTQILTIANTGQVPVRFEFIKKPNDSSYCKQWLNIKPFTSFIMPGEKCDVDLEVYVDKRTAHKLNADLDHIYDILVLHLDGGKDLFITVSGYYEPSTFGSSLDALVHMKLPIREVPHKELTELEKSAESLHLSKQPVFEIPKEMWILVNHLYKFCLTQEDLFQQHGLHSEVQQIRNKLDSGHFDLKPCSIHSVAEAFLLFLEALVEPVIPYRFYQKCLDCSHSFMLCKQVINEIPKIHRDVFRYLIYFLRELLDHSSLNKLDAKLLATIFGGILLRPYGSSSDNHLEFRRIDHHSVERRKATFVYHFLMNNDWDD